MKIEVEELLDSVPALGIPGTRIGLPDDATPVAIADPGQFAAGLDAALQAFRELRPSAPYLVNAEINSYHKEVWIRFVQPGPNTDRGRFAFERWDIAQCGIFASQSNPHSFTVMPDLDDAKVASALHQRITFALSDWTDLPVEDGGVDAIFATNALPRDSAVEQVKVLNEWIRAVRPGGMAFIAQHNFPDIHYKSVLGDAGWFETNISCGKRPAESKTTAYQVLCSSG